MFNLIRWDCPKWPVGVVVLRSTAATAVATLAVRGAQFAPLASSWWLNVLSMLTGSARLGFLNIRLFFTQRSHARLNLFVCVMCKQNIREWFKLVSPVDQLYKLAEF